MHNLTIMNSELGNRWSLISCLQGGC